MFSTLSRACLITTANIALGLVIFSLPISVFASGGADDPNQDPAANIGKEPRYYLNVNLFRETAAGVKDDLARSKDGAVLVNIEYWVEKRSEIPGEKPKKVKVNRYAWISIENAFPDHGAQLQDFDIDVIPVSNLTEIETKNGGSILSGFRYFPSRYRRDVNGGTNSSAKISTIGYFHEEEAKIKPHSHSSSLAEEVSAQEEKDSRMALFSNVAVDALGLRFLDLDQRKKALGLELVRFQGEVGVNYDFNENYSIEWTALGLDQDLAYGGRSLGSGGFIFDTEIFTRLALVYQNFSLWFQYGIEHFHGQSAEQILQLGLSWDFNGPLQKHRHHGRTPKQINQENLKVSQFLSNSDPFAPAAP